MTVSTITLKTPDGPFSVVAGPEAVLGAGWTDDIGILMGLIHPTLRPAQVQQSTSAIIDQASTAVEEYYQGRLDAPSTVPVLQHSSPFRRRIWDILRTIPAGVPLTYAQLAERAGNPKAVRAAGGGCAFNAAALFVPCHRIIRSDGTLGGFRYGLAIKRSLLDRES